MKLFSTMRVRVVTQIMFETLVEQMENKPKNFDITC